MLKKIALGGLFALGVALGTAGSVSAKAGATKAGKTVNVTHEAKGFCLFGMPC
jgi:hypothetical protein